MKIICSILDADYIAERVSQLYAIGTIKKCTFISQGLNDTYLIICSQGKFIARLYRHKWRSREEIDGEIDFVTHLATNSAPVATFIPANNGAYVHSLQCPEGERFLALMQCAADSEYEIHAITHNTAFNYGTSVGLLHNTSVGFGPTKTRRPINCESLIWQPLAAVQAMYPQHCQLDYLRRYANHLSKEIASLDAAGLTQLCIHGDLTGGNGNQDSSGSYTLFDFDCCGLGWLGYDLAVFLWSLLQNNKVHLWSEFLDGYKSVAPLANVDERSIGLFVAARNFWIMGYSLSRVAVLGTHSYNESIFIRDVEFLQQLGHELPHNLCSKLSA